MFTVDVRSRALQVQVRMGDTAAVRARARRLEPTSSATAPECASRSRRWRSNRTTRESAVEALAPVIDGSAPALYVSLGARSRHCCSTPRPAIASATGAAAEESLEAALELAEPEGLLLPFMLWPSRELLERHPRHRTAHADAARDDPRHACPGRGSARTGGAACATSLSEAELRVLRYLPSNLTASEIASELIVSANTVRTHMRHIYAKLDAHTRSEAVARARELRLVAPGAPAARGL